jgi:hypothetical protein
MVALLRYSAAILSWLAWLALAPAFGFPETAPAAMFDWLLKSTGRGWLVLLASEIAVVALYAFAVRRRLLGQGLVPALGFAVAVWLVVGVVVMPVMGALSPPGAPADAMRPTFMMLHLGPLAAVSALIGRVLYGVVLGSNVSGGTAGA